jgi:hypothetical protein
MLNSRNLKTFFTVSLALLIFACNSSSKNDKSKKEKQADTAIVEAPMPANNPPGVEMTKEEQKCFSNQGLKYETVIMISYDGDGKISGNVMSKELDSDKEEVTRFSGTAVGDKFTVKFKGTPPVIGAASEWTDKPWIIKKVEGKGTWSEMLHIVFHAKNYETNKWEDTEYLFAPVDCK